MLALRGRGPIESGADGFFGRHRTRFVRELSELVRFPSISAQPSGHPAMQGCATWLRGQLERLGAVDARILPGEKHPAVFGRIPGPRGAPRVLIYGHYDVQPVDPLGAWRAPPFEPHVQGGALFGRGASDDKGQLFAHFKALELLRQRRGPLPASVSFLIDGEEEIGSPSLPELFRQLGPELSCDVAVVSDTTVLGERRPSITHALRGDLYLEVRVCRHGQDVHSGRFGGVVDNALDALLAALSRLHRRDGSVAVRGFYDGVRPVSPLERAYMRRVGPAPRDVQRNAGGAHLSGEAGYTPYERTTIRPSLEVSGVRGGYQGVGIQGVIPACASAKLDLRFVAQQEPSALRRAVTEHLRAALPASFTLTVSELVRVQPVVLDREHWTMRAAARAYTRAFGVAPVFLRSGGSIRAASLLSECLAVPTVLLGFGLQDDGAHAPNERFKLGMLAKGILTSAAFLEEVGAR